MGENTNELAWFSVRGERADFCVRSVDAPTAVDAAIGNLAKQPKLGVDPWVSDFKAEPLPPEQAKLQDKIATTSQNAGCRVLLMALDVDQRIPGRDYPYTINLAI